MSSSQRRKFNCERKRFSNELCKNSFVIQHIENVIRLICQNTIAVLKEYNIKRQYSTKHAVEFDGIDSQLPFDEIEQFKMFLSMQEVFHAYEKYTELLQN